MERDGVAVMEVKVEQEGQRTVTLSKLMCLFEDGFFFFFFLPRTTIKGVCSACVHVFVCACVYVAFIL